MNDEVLNEHLTKICSDQLKINKEFDKLDKLETIEQRNIQLSKIALALSRIALRISILEKEAKGKSNLYPQIKLLRKSTNRIAKRVKKVLKKSTKLEQTFIKREYRND
ncbi:hypothetical protein ACQRB9_06935 [Lactobacillus johnsonii]|uniref:hypothetical protein n=1 Tax=Lactobacillus johnsonii TaxID=33959 RepID=UPI003D077DD1